jgi:CPA2 family monovalent cation:H+ antiporter-2
MLLLIVASVGVPLALLLGAVTGIQYVWVVLAAGLLTAVFVAVYRARELDVDIQSGGLMMLRAIADQGLPQEPTSDHSPSSLGLTNLHEVALEESSYAVGKTLAELRLRSLTGATVIAVRLRGEANQHPMPDEPLQASDVLLVAGCRADQLAAETLLRNGHETPGST